MGVLVSALAGDKSSLGTMSCRATTVMKWASQPFAATAFPKANSPTNGAANVQQTMSRADLPLGFAPAVLWLQHMHGTFDSDSDLNKDSCNIPNANIEDGFGKIVEDGFLEITVI